MKKQYYFVNQNAILPYEIAKKLSIGEISNILHLSTQEVYKQLSQIIKNKYKLFILLTMLFASNNSYANSSDATHLKVWYKHHVMLATKQCKECVCKNIEYSHYKNIFKTNEVTTENCDKLLHLFN